MRTAKDGTLVRLLRDALAEISMADRERSLPQTLDIIRRIADVLIEVPDDSPGKGHTMTHPEPQTHEASVTLARFRVIERAFSWMADERTVTAANHARMERTELDLYNALRSLRNIDPETWRD